MDEYSYGPVLAKAERKDDGEVVLHLIRDEQIVHLDADDEFYTLMLKKNPWIDLRSN